jgi:hypothetical protein
MARIVTASGRNSDKSVTTDLSTAQAIEFLRVGLLNGEIRGDFAAGLVADHDRYRNRGGLLGNRAAWAVVVAQQTIDSQRRADQPAPGAARIENVEGIIGLFATATASKLKYPKIRLETETGRPVVLALAGAGSRYPGQVNVSSGHRYGDSAGKFYGRIAPDGSTGVTDPDVLELLHSFAVDPAAVAAEYGHRTGACCFCSIQLTDPRSVDVGYGPICAGKYGLPLGNRRGSAEARADLFGDEEEEPARPFSEFNDPAADAWDAHLEARANV